MRVVISLMVIGLLAACAAPSGRQAGTLGKTADSHAEPPAVEAPPRSAPLQAESNELSGDFCTPDGYWSFFEAFVRSPQVRARYTTAAARDAITPFHIALVDNRWHYTGAIQGPGNELLDIKESRNGDSFRVDYVRAKFGPDDELIETYGKPGAYVFRFTEGCWRLVEAIQ